MPLAIVGLTVQDHVATPWLSAGCVALVPMVTARFALVLTASVHELPGAAATLTVSVADRRTGEIVATMLVVPARGIAAAVLEVLPVEAVTEAPLPGVDGPPHAASTNDKVTPALPATRARDRLSAQRMPGPGARLRAGPRPPGTTSAKASMTHWWR